MRLGPLVQSKAQIKPSFVGMLALSGISRISQLHSNCSYLVYFIITVYIIRTKIDNINCYGLGILIVTNRNALFRKEAARPLLGLGRKGSGRADTKGK